MTQEELKRGQEQLYQRLYAAGGVRRPAAGQPVALPRRASPAGAHARQQLRDARPDGPPLLARGPRRTAILRGESLEGVRQSPRLIAQMVIYMGMYLHFCKVHGQTHGQTLTWDPWQRLKHDAR